MSTRLALSISVIWLLLIPLISAADGKSTSEVANFIRSKNACVFAAGAVWKAPTQSKGCASFVNAKPGELYSCGGFSKSNLEVLCVFDTTTGAGGTNEWRGCAISFYDLQSGTYTDKADITPIGDVSFIKRDGPCTYDSVKAILDADPMEEHAKRLTALRRSNGWNPAPDHKFIQRKKLGSVWKAYHDGIELRDGVYGGPPTGTEVQVLVDKFGVVSPKMAGWSLGNIFGSARQSSKDK